MHCPAERRTWQIGNGDSVNWLSAPRVQAPFHHNADGTFTYVRAKGDTFTFSEISGWLKEAGFTDARTVDAPSVSPLVLATKPR